MMPGPGDVIAVGFWIGFAVALVRLTRDRRPPPADLPYQDDYLDHHYPQRRTCHDHHPRF